MARLAAVLATALLLGSAASAAVRPVTLRLALRYPFVCGSAIAPLRISLPPELSVPRSSPDAAVRMNGQAAGRVAVDGHDVTVAAARPTGVMCQIVVERPLTIVFTHAADIGSPTSSATYYVNVRYGTHAGRVKLVVSA